MTITEILTTIDKLLGYVMVISIIATIARFAWIFWTTRAGDE